MAPHPQAAALLARCYRANPDFVAFVRMALGLPVVEDPLLEAMESFMKLYAAFLTDRGDRLQEQVDALNRNTFSNLWPIEDWIVSALDPDKFQVTPGSTRAS